MPTHRMLSISLCILSTFLLSQANATERSMYYSNAISANTALQNTLEEMGYSVEEAAKQFEEAERVAEESNLDLKLGTLAICGKIRGGLLLGASGAICTTLFNAYSVKTTSVSIGGQMMAGLGAIYFRTSNRKNKKYCYMGAGYSTGFYIYAEGGVMAEVACGDAEDKMGWERGFLVHVAIGGGVGADVSGDMTTVTHLSNYWGVL